MGEVMVEASSEDLSGVTLVVPGEMGEQGGVVCPETARFTLRLADRERLYQE